MGVGEHIESTRRGGRNRDVTFLAYRLARLLSVLFAVLTVWLLWSVGRRAFDTLSGLLAAAFLSVTMGLANLAHFATPETTLFFVVLAALASFEALAAEPTRRRYAAAGLLVGLACSTKYTVWVLGVPFLAAHMLGSRQARSDRPPWVPALALAAGAAIAGFVIATPYSILTPRKFVEDMIFNWVTGAPQGTLAGQQRTWGTYVLTLGNALGWPLLALAVSGAAALSRSTVAREGRGRAALIVHGVWIAAFWGFYGVSPHHALRFIMPIVPSLLLLGAAGVAIVMRTGAPVTRRTALFGTAAVLVYSLAYTAMADRKFLRDPRYAAGEWLNEHVGADTIVGHFAPEPYLPYFSRPAFRLQFLDAIAQTRITGSEFQSRIDNVVANGPDVILDANFYFDRFVGAPDRFPERAAFYGRLLEGRGAGTFKPAARFDVHGPWWLDPIPELVAPEIVVFARASTRWR
jgi:hypothetical protein